MKFYYSLVDDAFVQAPGIRQKLTSLDGLKRGSQIPFEVQFLDGENADIPTTVAAESLLHFGLKLTGKYEGDWLAYIGEDDWTLPGTGDAGGSWYKATLNLNTTELNAAFNTPDLNAANDLPTVTTMTVFSVREPAMDNPRFADELACVVANSGDIGTEGIPAIDVPGITARLSAVETQANNTQAIAETLETQLPAVFLPNVNNYTGGTSSDLDGVVTLSTLNPPFYAIFTGPLGSMEFYLLVAGTAAESSPDIILPDDYDAGTNAKAWYRQYQSVVVNPVSGSGSLGALNLSYRTTTIATSGAATATLAAGTNGQEKRIYMVTDGGDCVVTVTNLQGGTTITFNDQEDFVELQYLNAKWKVLKNSGCTIA